MNDKISQNFLYKKNRLQQIKGFYYTVRCNGISQAAQAMNLTQSTVTLQIQSLERDLGLQLLKRENRSISLTKDGEEFYKSACPLMQEFESILEQFLLKKNKDEQKLIKIAMHHIAISYLMPKVTANFKKIYPQVEILIQNIPPSEAIARLKDEKIDLAFYPNMQINPEIKLIETTSYDPILIMNKFHPLAKMKIGSLKDLKKFDLIKIDSNLTTLPLFESAVTTHNLKGSIKFENGNWEMLKHFVKQNDFIAVVSEICLDKNDDDLIQKNLSSFFPQMCYSIAFKKGKVPKSAVEGLANLLKEARSG